MKVDFEVWPYYVMLYRRVNGQWVLQRELEHSEHYSAYQP